ncbi:restriction endonuclease subunit S [Aromatoleum bremense]|uniref:Restriction endonuclease subunit S n=1 Tax=Aromatoleum bremense TaxID=76115 RepID=A0ABX1NY03_9RHOO|nr:restriction endonuclease subunit S [Aromatoleum bremense]NMG16920.1 restriction endonuclease subunit S [Aromatoleum bremense]
MEVMEPSAKYLAKPAYKQTEVGVIPEEWEVKTIGESLRLINGRAFRPDEWQQSGLPIIRIQNLNDTESAFNYFAGPIEERHRIEPGDLLFAWSGTTGTSFGARLWGGPTGVLNQHIFKVVPNLKNLTMSYAFLVLRKVQEQIEKQAHGFKASFVHVKKSDLVGVLLPVPPSKAEQQAIAEALSDADALIESLEQLLAKKRQIKQGAMQELLTGQKRLPGFAGGWAVKRLGELASIQRGASPRPIDSPVWFDENSSVGWVRISDVTQAGMHLTETTQRLSAQGIQHSRPVAKDSLIMSICATVGRPIITKIDTCIHDGFVVFDKLLADQKFLYYMLSSIEDDWSRHGQTGSQMNLNTGLINSTAVPMPPTVEEQTAIATVLSDMDAEIAALETKLAKARSLKQGMMQELLTGRIRLV